MRKIVVLIVLFLLTWPTLAQVSTHKSFASDDGAVQFTYPTEWTIEDQLTSFNQRYLYILWTDSDDPLMDNNDRSRVLLEIVNPLTSQYPENLSTPLDYATYNFSMTETKNLANHKVFAVMPPLVSISVGEEASQPPDFSTKWYSARISASKAFTLATDPAERIELLFPDVAHRQGILDVVVRSDQWITLASITTPEGKLKSAEQTLLDLVQSLKFDAKKATIPFKRNIDVYDVSNIPLSLTYISAGGNLELSYPHDWQIIKDEPYENPPAAYYLQFAPSKEDAKLVIMILDTTRDIFGYGRNRDSSSEFMREMRLANVNKGSQYRIGNYDAVSIIQAKDNNMQQLLCFGLNEFWVTCATVTAKNTNVLTQYEAPMVAVLASLKFGLGEPVINTAGIRFNLPEDWKLDTTQQENGDYYLFTLRPTGIKRYMDLHFTIEMVDLKARGYIKKPTIKELKAMLAHMPTTVNESHVETIGDFRVLDSQVFNETEKIYGENTLCMLNERWLLVIWGYAYTADEAQGTIPIIDSIIKGIELALPKP